MIDKDIKNFQEQLSRVEAYSLLAAKNVLTIDDVCVLTGLTKSHIYKLTCTKDIPHYKPNAKLLFFDRCEIEAWQKQNRVLTKTEAEQRAAAYVVKKGDTL